ncbi:NAD(P)/FAD-dependent oxidoreductase [Stygiolobus caldivivus]|uniref:Uncharacterized protein n=1 Tax=Stygiolobus caldivivus TaxID=2824673 RepID=A0A8D5U6N0_9CREN|nr:NAD(P)/FAD-dependent oxidoreductase [Stygiolobus caldivivus]BCU70526.1 hypothetical protein KN1_18230 [Stygiolobus caldivivus]
MNLILGGGLAGLLLASKLEDSILVEAQNKIGGILAYEEIEGYDIPLYPPLLKSECNLFQGLEHRQVSLSVSSRKEDYLTEKLGVSGLPDWLTFKGSKVYFIQNMKQVLEQLYKKAKVRLSTTFNFKGDKTFILNNGQVIRASEVYVTVPPYLLGLKKGRSIGFVEAILTTNKTKRDSNVIIDGDKGVLYSHVIIADWLSDFFDVYYILVPFIAQIPSWDRIYGDLKRRGVLKKEEIRSFRYRVIRDAVLEDSNKEDFSDSSLEKLHFCGRLGKWKNLNICETIDDVLHC